VFPLKWIAQGMRAAILPDSFKAAEPGGEWALGLVAIMLAIWLIVGLILSRATFRWIRHNG
jgi:ABC-2 type transport system permease protein